MIRCCSWRCHRTGASDEKYQEAKGSVMGTASWRGTQSIRVGSLTDGMIRLESEVEAILSFTRVVAITGVLRHPYLGLWLALLAGPLLVRVGAFHLCPIDA
jgi:hypothetical protein